MRSERTGGQKHGAQRSIRGGLLLLAAALSSGCIAPRSRVTPSPSMPAPPPFVTAHGRDHPLAGRLFDVASRTEQTPAALIERLRDARFILLGERHDQPDHHALQAFVVASLAGAGRRPGVAFEMLHEGQAGALRRSLAAAPADVDALAVAVNWEASGWPDFSLYRPVFLATLESALRVYAANLPPARVRAAGLGSPDAAVRALLDEAAVPSGAGRARLAATIDRSHCGHASPAMIEAMIESQRLRDAAMARALVAADAEGRDGAVLIAGSGHVARDHGVPLQLVERAPGASVLSIAFVEVRDGVTDPFAPSPGAANDDGIDAFDVVWFTPRLDDDDPCVKYRDALKGIGHGLPMR